MALSPECNEDKMPNQIDRHRTTLEYEIGCFTRIACRTLLETHAHATSCERLTG